MGKTHLALRASCRSLGQTQGPEPLPKIISAMAPAWGGVGWQGSHLEEANRGDLPASHTVGAARLSPTDSDKNTPSSP